VIRDLAVVGAGPAGISAALWARSLELDVLLVDAAPAPGGQLHAVHFHPLAVPGFEHGDGPALAAAYTRQLAASGVPWRGDCASVSLRPPGDSGEPAEVGLTGGEPVLARAVLIATGVRRRRLGVPGERELEGRGVSFSATRDHARLAGRTVAVVGGGDAAFENALMLAAAGGFVDLLVRGEPRARSEFRERVAADRRIRVHRDARVTAIVGEGGVTGVRFEGPGGGGEIAAQGVVIKIGVLPNSEWCRDAVGTDEEGYVRVDAGLATSAIGVWAAGDITRPVPPSVPVAIGQGAQVATAIRAAIRGA
jgi:thioredoxin reductase (NADPH)